MKEVKKRSKKKIFGIVIILAIITISGMIGYERVIKPKKYAEYINQGNEYLSQQYYEGAVESFEKAIKIYDDTTEPKLGAAQGYIGLNNTNRAISYLIEAQNLNIEDEELISEIIEIIVDVDVKTANELLQNFIDRVGVDNVSETFRANILEATDKDEINTYMENAQNLYDNAVEGELEGQYKVGSKEKLLTIIKEAQDIKDNYFASQEEINSMVSLLNGAINTFENEKVKVIPAGLANQYISRLEAIESGVNALADNLYYSNAEMGDFLCQAADEYKAIMDDIYSDLNKYLSSDKKAQLSSEMTKYENEKAKAQAELDRAHAESPGTWYVTGEPDSRGTVIREHCYYLINKYMI